MDRTKLKNYAPKARREFIEAMSERAAFYGLTADKSEPIVEKGDVAVIGGRSFPIAVARKQKSLEDRIKRYGFQQTMEAMAYTWFNRLVAIRYMELHGYLDHGYRVLSHPDGKPMPEILEHAEHIDFKGLKKDRVIDLKLAGNKEGELYRLLLTAQCNALHSAMPFLFERIDDETELLLPDNLLNSDSLIRKLVNEIDEADWNEVEIIGWLYQFYISEKKDEVIGKVVATEDIPAATQLFTPNWIVKYLVQNTLGRHWLATYPQSALRQQMEYYIEPAEQTPEVQEQLKAITPTSLNPEALTLLDPACGSGHILVEAYDLFRAIYQERGYRAKDIPALILQKNLFGMEIDDRAAQLAAFALMMKARADDRRIFDSEAKPNILAFEDSQGMNANEIAYALNAPINKDDVPNEYLFEEIQEEKDGLFSKKALAEKGHVSQGDIAALLELFENAKTFGSLIQVPAKLAAKLPEIEKRLDEVLTHGDLTHASAHVLKPLLRQLYFLGRKYSCVVANPPYLSRKGMTDLLKEFAKQAYANLTADVFAMFIKRCADLAQRHGLLGFVTPYVWMFIDSYEKLRTFLLSDTRLTSLVQLEYNAFEPACVPVCAFVLANSPGNHEIGTFISLSDFKGHDNQPPRTLEAIRNKQCKWRYDVSTAGFLRIPGSPYAYRLSPRCLKAYSRCELLTHYADVKEGLNTGDNDQFFRFWYEVDNSGILFGCKDSVSASASGKKWFPCNKGGGFRKWYGNNDNVINWCNDGHAIRNLRNDKGKVVSAVRNTQYYFRSGLTWSGVGSSGFSVRWFDNGFVFNSVGRSLFPFDNAQYLLGFLNSRVCSDLIGTLSPTLNFSVGDIASLPIQFDGIEVETVAKIVSEAVALARKDWDCYETSWDFQRPISLCCQAATLRSSQEAADAEFQSRFVEMKRLEEENNRHFIDAYGLQSELTPEVPDDQITLYRPTPEEDIKRLLSYAIGCMMGRYSLDKPGLIYAHSGNQGFDPSQYSTFRADDDGIIPLLETDWGIRDDATNRFAEFVSVAWPKEHLEENLKFVADSLSPNNGEQPRDTIRRYLANGFYKHHLSMYKKRPIYWLFSSGKLRSFQCLVYLHRYNEGTLARMRTEYVIPLQGQIAARIEQLEGDKAKATSTSHRNKIQKEQDKLKKQQVELASFEEKLKHYADMRISLDLDDGVKVNYAKFGDLLVEVKTVTGGSEE
jgi:hypothetical protein